jgi:predicted nucleic acid-binding protein
LKRAEMLMFSSEHPARGEKVLEYAANSQASVYDCEYIVLADDFGTILVTTDEPLIKHFPKIAVHLRDYARLT